MVLSDWDKHLVTLALLVFFPNSALSDDQRERLLELMLEGDSSKFSTPATILEGHPRCSGPGQTAFSIDIEANDIEFGVSGDGWNGKAWQFNRFDALAQTDTCIVGDNADAIGYRGSSWDEKPEDVCEDTRPREQVFQEEIAPAICYRTERRGVEVSSVPVECPNDQYGDKSESLNALLRAANIEVNMSAKANVCQTLSGTGLLDSEWVVTIASEERTEEFAGVFGPNRWVDPRQESPIKVRLVYDRRDTFLMNTTDEIANGPFQLDPMRSGNLRLSFEIEKFVLSNEDVPPVKLEGGRSFRLDIQ